MNSKVVEANTTAWSASNASFSTGKLEDDTEFAIVDIILSGSAIKGESSWVIQDTAPEVVADWHNPTSRTGRGRAVLKTVKGSTAGGVVGPLPSK